MTAQSIRRLFFALWPNEVIQHRLAEVARQLVDETQGKPISWQNIHATLAFLGDVPVEQIPALLNLAEQYRQFSCELVLDRVAVLNHGIVYAAATKPPTQLLDLATSLRSALRESGYCIEHRRFLPHITLLRNSLQAPRQNVIAPIFWPLSGPRLVQSELRRAGAVYQLLS